MGSAKGGRSVPRASLSFSMRRARPLLVLPLFAWLLTVSGCYAGLAGVVLGALAASSAGGGGADLLPTAAIRGVSFSVSPDDMEVKFRISNDDDGLLSAQVEFARVDEIDGELIDATPREAATPMEGTNPVEDVPNNEIVSFRWNAGVDLGGDSADVRIYVTPFEDGRAGSPDVTDPERAGNTPPTIRIDRLEHVSDQILVFFDIVDQESDRFNLTGLELDFRGFREDCETGAIDWSDFESLPSDKVFDDDLRRDFPSSPVGEPGSLSFSTSKFADAADENLRVVGVPGFVGELKIKILGNDFGDDSSEDEGVLSFDNNEPPNILPLLLPETPSNGLIVLRYLLIDPNANPAEITFEVNLDGTGFTRANEFPSAYSDGTRDLGTEGFGVVHRYVWDAVSQTSKARSATLKLRASDRECPEVGERTIDVDLSSFRSPGLHSAAALWVGKDPSCLTTGDFNGDGYLDIVVGIEGAGRITYLRGGIDGLSSEGQGEVRVGDRPIAATSGNYDEDRFLDVVVANQETHDLSYVQGFELGLRPTERRISLGNERFPTALATGNFNADQFLDVAVANRDSESVTYLWGGEDGLLAGNQRVIRVGRTPVALGSGNYNGDGYRDLMVVNKDSDNVTYLEGGDDGLSAVRRRQIAVGRTPVALTSGRFDVDQILDAAVANLGSESLSYIRGGVEAPVRQENIRIGIPPSVLTSGDYDGDGFFDVAAGSENLDLESPSLVCVRGGFDGLSETRRTEIPLPGETGAFALASGDYDGDGFCDVVLSKKLELGPLSLFDTGLIFFRGGRGGLSVDRREEIGLWRKPGALASGDFDRDGFLDLAVVNRLSDDVSYLRGQGRGLRRRRDRTPVSVFDPTAFVSGDFDRDGFSDVVVANRTQRFATYLSGGPDGITREPKADIPIGDAPTALASGDFDGDGILDVAVANENEDTVTDLGGEENVVENVVLSRRSDIDVGMSPVAVTSGHFDGDEVVDAAVVNRGSNSISYIRGQADVGLSSDSRTDIEVGLNPVAIASGDYDGDGFADVLVVNRDSHSVTCLRGGDDGLSADRSEEIPVGQRPLAVVNGDYDADGFLDAVVANQDSNSVTYLRGEGEIGLSSSRRRDIAVEQDPVALASQDYDGDGFLDIAVANRGSNSVSYLRGDPMGLSDALTTKVGVGREPVALTSGDFDADGFFDLLVANRASNSVIFVPGGPDGLSGDSRREREIGVVGPPVRLASGDYDGDGLLDVLVGTRTPTAPIQAVTYLGQHFFSAHVNLLVDPPADAEERLDLLDPRDPPQYRLDLPLASLESRTRVSIVQVPVFELPSRRERFEEGKFLNIVTGAVSLLPERNAWEGDAVLALRLRPGALSPQDVNAPEHLRVFLRVPDSERPLRRMVLPEITTFNDVPPERGENRWIRFPIERFGTYLVAYERDRPEP